MAKAQTNYVACFGLTESTERALFGEHKDGFQFLKFTSLNGFFSVAENNKHLFRAILVEGAEEEGWGLAVKSKMTQAGYGHLPFVLVADKIDAGTARFIQGEGVAEVFLKPLSADAIVHKLQLISESRQPAELTEPYEYRIPLGKRMFDIAFASLALLALSPLFLVVALLIRLQAKGPVFYYSLRVGTGYKIFRFYKFRSMAVDADKKLSGLKHLNQYSEDRPATTARVKQLCDGCALTQSACSSPLYADNEMWCEKLYKEYVQAKGQNTFVKIKNDPRITPTGKFIRDAGIDELPQLWNVLKGDMSLAGNRPLPLYEAEKLTTDKFALRFMAPAGITGLWQVSKRGSGKMNEEERISLDNDYAKSYGLFFDMKLLLRTIPALMQKRKRLT
jgi:lipopolysaccharide/colanic/teichoic acid biosynthesis glycosyltransferase